jgi:hypothetical protein
MCAIHRSVRLLALPANGVITDYSYSTDITAEPNTAATTGTTASTSTTTANAAAAAAAATHAAVLTADCSVTVGQPLDRRRVTVTASLYEEGIVPLPELLDSSGNVVNDVAGGDCTPDLSGTLLHNVLTSSMMIQLVMCCVRSCMTLLILAASAYNVLPKQLLDMLFISMHDVQPLARTLASSQAL